MKKRGFLPALTLGALMAMAFSAAALATIEHDTGRLLLAAEARGARATDLLARDVLAAAEAQGSFDGVRAVLTEPDRFLTQESVTPLYVALQAALVTGDLLGRFHVTAESHAAGFQFSAPLARAFTFAEPAPAPRRPLAPSPSLGTFDFEPLPPQEAIDFFSQKVPMTKDAFNQLDVAYRARAFTIAYQEEEAAVGVVQGWLDRVLRDGLTLDDFRKGLDEAAAAGGILEVNPYHAETVFRTNVQTAYNAGRYEMYQAEGMAESFPYYQYHTVGDDRVRPAHAAMNGYIAKRDASVWNIWWPPNGFNCRCTVTAISIEEAKSKGVRVSRRDTGKPDAGFAGNPAKEMRG